VNVTGASALSTDNQAAIVAGGDISITGTSASSSYFQGLVYSQGSGGVTVMNSTVVGTVVSAQVNAPTVLSNANIAFNPTVVNASYAQGWSGNTTFTVQVAGAGGSSTPVTLALANITQANGTQVAPTPAAFLAAGQTSLQPGNFTVVGESPSDPNYASDLASAFQGAQLLGIDALNAELATMQSSTVLQTGAFKLDLNQFLNSSGQLHIVWKHDF
jgi:hypothetical protein